MRPQPSLDPRSFPRRQPRLFLQFLHSRRRSRRRSLLSRSSPASSPATATATATSSSPAPALVPHPRLARELRQRQAFHQRLITLNLRQTLALVLGELLRRRHRVARSALFFKLKCKKSLGPCDACPRDARVRSRSPR